MRLEQAISIIVGIILSIVLQAVPRVEKWWSRKQWKVLILLALHVGGGLILWLLDCEAGVGTGVEVTCNWEGLLNSGWTGLMGFISNQTTYGLTNYTKAGQDVVQSLRSYASCMERSEDVPQ